MRAFVIAVGSELLGDDRLDTNSLKLTACFAAHGVEVVGKSVVGDSADALVAHLRHGLAAAEVVVLTGGLGPTTDDMTREAVGLALERQLSEEPSIVEDIRAKFAGFGMAMPKVNRRQAMVIDGAQVLSNSRGTAPGLRLEHDGRQIFLLPGVPHELIHMIETHLEPWLEREAPGRSFASRSLRVSCRSESAVEEALEGLYEAFRADEITVLAKPGDIEVRFTVHGDQEDVLQDRLARMASAATEALGRAVYAQGRDACLESVVGGLLTAARRTLVTAESCTGGLIAERLTSVAGSSRYFLGGAVTYSNALKQSLIGVSAATLSAHGAVSAEVALEMAIGARQRLGADYAISATGIAGPDGGTSDKPVGTVHVAIAGPDPDRTDPDRKVSVDHRHLSWPGASRERVRRLTSQWALELLRRRLLVDAEPS